MELAKRRHRSLTPIARGVRPRAPKGSKEIAMTRNANQLTYFAVAAVVAGYSLALIAQVALHLAA